MAGLFPSIGNSQNVDVNGQPLSASVLTVYNGGTLVLASCFQDIGLAIPAQNPITADITGRLPIFYVADGVYRVRLVDQTGVMIYDYPQVASIGASSSGGGGSAVDPTTVASTGDTKFRPTGEVLTGWVKLNGQTIGSGVSGATQRANADTQTLYIYLWNLGYIVPAGRGANGLADFNANKPLVLPDWRGRSTGGLGDMGFFDSGVLAGALFLAGNATTPGSIGGEAAHVLLQVELPAIAPTFAGAPQTVATNDAVMFGAGASAVYQPGAAGHQAATSVTFTPAGTISPLGSGFSGNRMSPFVLGSFYMKL